MDNAKNTQIDLDLTVVKQEQFDEDDQNRCAGQSRAANGVSCDGEDQSTQKDEAYAHDTASNGYLLAFEPELSDYDDQCDKDDVSQSNTTSPSSSHDNGSHARLQPVSICLTTAQNFSLYILHLNLTNCAVNLCQSRYA